MVQTHLGGLTWFRGCTPGVAADGRYPGSLCRELVPNILPLCRSGVQLRPVVEQEVGCSHLGHRWTIGNDMEDVNVDLSLVGHDALQ